MTGYGPREKEFAFQEFADRAEVVAACERFNGLLGRGYRVDVSFRGVPVLPAAKLTVRVKRGGEWTERVVTASEWRAGTTKSAEFADVGGRDVKPSEYEVVLEVTHQGWTHSRHLAWKNE